MDGGPVPSWVEIEGCDMSRCSIVSGAEVVLTSEITAVVPATSMHVTLVGFLLGIRVPFDLPADVQDGCNAVQGGCPVSVGVTYQLGTRFNVATPDLIIGASPHIELAATNEGGVRVMCARVQATITAN